MRSTVGKTGAVEVVDTAGTDNGTDSPALRLPGSWAYSGVLGCTGGTLRCTGDTPHVAQSIASAMVAASDGCMKKLVPIETLSITFPRCKNKYYMVSY